MGSTTVALRNYCNKERKCAGLLKYTVLYKVYTGTGAGTGVDHQAQQWEQTLRFHRLKIHVQDRILSIPSSPSPCFLSISLYPTEEGNDNDNDNDNESVIWGDTARTVMLNGLTSC